MTKEKQKEYNKKYYEEHKKEIYEKQKEWRHNHKEQFKNLIYKCRRKKAERLKEQGIKYPWKSDKERELLSEKAENNID